MAIADNLEKGFNLGYKSSRFAPLGDAIRSTIQSYDQQNQLESGLTMKYGLERAFQDPNERAYKAAQTRLATSTADLYDKFGSGDMGLETGTVKEPDDSQFFEKYNVPTEDRDLYKLTPIYQKIKGFPQLVDKKPELTESGKIELASRKKIQQEKTKWNTDTKNLINGLVSSFNSMEQAIPGDKSRFGQKMTGMQARFQAQTGFGSMNPLAVGQITTEPMRARSMLRKFETGGRFTDKDVEQAISGMLNPEKTSAERFSTLVTTARGAGTMSGIDESDIDNMIMEKFGIDENTFQGLLGGTVASIPTKSKNPFTKQASSGLSREEQIALIREALSK